MKPWKADFTQFGRSSILDSTSFIHCVLLCARARACVYVCWVAPSGGLFSSLIIPSLYLRVQALLASCFVPIWGSFKPLTFRGKVICLLTVVELCSHVLLCHFFFFFLIGRDSTWYFYSFLNFFFLQDVLLSLLRFVDFACDANDVVCWLNISFVLGMIVAQTMRHVGGRIFKKKLFLWEGLLNTDKRQQIAKTIISICLLCSKSRAFTRP